jgi:Zn-dependent protease with chaperone function
VRDFYQRQSTARSQTQYLIALFCLTLVVLVLVTSAIVSNLAFVVRDIAGQVDPPVFDPWIMLGTGLVTLLIILFGCVWKSQELRNGGGVALAASLQARLIQESQHMSQAERKFLNVVQEVAIAAGIAPPHVCVLDYDRGINAFAAGFTLRDAVIGATRGCIEKLNREQLQGVVAHECSHILNGDMLINMRTLVVLHGVFGIDILGRWLLIVSKQQWVEADNLQENFVGKMVASIGLAVLGTMLIVVGSLGTLCGLILSAAVSRQREYLADASAVELTRNPLGIANALKFDRCWRPK